MVSVEEAKKILGNAVQPLGAAVVVKTSDALGYTLAQDIYAPIHLPPFNQSNVDGYAVKLSSGKENKWKVVGEIKAGDKSELKLRPGEAVRIFTGAMVPADSDLVVMQERIVCNSDTIVCNDELLLKPREHIRFEGEQIKKGELALAAGTVCNPSSIGFIASLGIDAIKVFRKPIVSLIITGNELQPPGSELARGKVYESNSVTLQSAISAMGLSVHKIVFATDNKQELEMAVKQLLQSNPDVLIVSGGISVGDYDFVKEALEINGTTELFYKVAQKPGKPLYFGKKQTNLVFGLPGNPASALTCFYEYVYPALRMLQGKSMPFLRNMELPITKPIVKKKGLAMFLKASVRGNVVDPLQGQESSKMRSFTGANAFIYLPGEQEKVSAGETVEVHLLPVYN